VRNSIAILSNFESYQNFFNLSYRDNMLVHAIAINENL